jgi:cold shock protein
VVKAVVRSWDSGEGWGILASAKTPGGCWAHYSVIEMRGYKTLEVGQVVDVEWKTPGQDGFDFCATRISLRA